MASTPQVRWLEMPMAARRTPAGWRRLASGLLAAFRSIAASSPSPVKDRCPIPLTARHTATALCLNPVAVTSVDLCSSGETSPACSGISTIAGSRFSPSICLLPPGRPPLAAAPPSAACRLTMGALQSLAALVWAVPTTTLAWGMIVSGLAAFVALMLSERLTAPYGRCAAAAPLPASRATCLLDQRLPVLRGVIPRCCPIPQPTLHRYSKAGWGLLIPPRIAWVVRCLPAAPLPAGTPPSCRACCLASGPGQPHARPPPAAAAPT